MKFVPTPMSSSMSASVESSAEPERMAPGTLRDALLWKYGHLGKPAIPPAHELSEPSHIAKMPETSGFILLPLSFLRGETRSRLFAFFPF